MDDAHFEKFWNITQSNNSNPKTITTENWVYCIIMFTMAILSLCGSILIIYSYVAITELRSTSRYLLVHLSIADSFTSVAVILGTIWFYIANLVPEPHSYLSLCVAYASLSAFSTIAAFLWTVAIGLYLQLCITMHRVTLATGLLPLFYCICWGMPAIVTIISLSSNVFGPPKEAYLKREASFCWIRDDIPNQYMWQFFTGKGWELTCYVIILAIYTHIGCHVRREFVQETGTLTVPVKKQVSSAERKMFIIPIVFILIRFWGTLRFLLGAYNEQYKQAEGRGWTWLVMMQALGDSTQGLANCVLFCFLTPRVRELLARRCCHRRDSNYKEINNSEYRIQWRRFRDDAGDENSSLLKSAHHVQRSDTASVKVS